MRKISSKRSLVYQAAASDEDLVLECKRFIVRGHPSECWEWHGGLSNNYPTIDYFQGSKHTRLSPIVLLFESEGIEPVEGRSFARSCHNRLCCNPAHFIQKQVVFTGQKLTRREVQEIRYLNNTGNHSQQNLAEKYNVSVSTISLIINYKRFKLES